MQATTDTTSAAYNGERGKDKDVASPNPEPMANDDGVLEKSEAEIPTSAGPPLASKITYPGAVLASILNIALLLSLFLVALDMVKYVV